jgi:hypothetical protein
MAMKIPRATAAAARYQRVLGRVKASEEEACPVRADLSELVGGNGVGGGSGVAAESGVHSISGT